MTTIKVPSWICIACSVALAIASFHAAARFATLAQVSGLWWLRSWEFMDAGLYTIVGIGTFAIACVPLIYGAVRRSHASVAVASLVSATLTYVALLQVWSSKPDVIDARHFATMGMSLIPLHISSLSVGVHVSIEFLAWSQRPR